MVEAVDLITWPLFAALQLHAGWAHVTYADLEAAHRAVTHLPGSDLLGNRIRAHFALPDPVVPPPPDVAAVAARQELIAVRKAQYQRRRARCGGGGCAVDSCRCTLDCHAGLPEDPWRFQVCLCSSASGQYLLFPVLIHDHVELMCITTRSSDHRLTDDCALGHENR